MPNYKGFDKNLKCRGFQYEIGKTFETAEPVKACSHGFHACEDPLDVFAYYPPASSRYCEVEQYGALSRGDDDSKVSSSKIKIGAELDISGLVKAKVEYVKAHTTTEHTDPERATAGEYGAATAGNRGAATAGNRGAATAGEYGAATAGYAGAATSRGEITVGENGCGLVRGNGVRARGGLGAVLVICVENDSNYKIKEWVAVTVDGETVKPDTWYTVENGKLKEV